MKVWSSLLCYNCSAWPKHACRLKRKIFADVKFAHAVGVDVRVHVVCCSCGGAGDDS